MRKHLPGLTTCRSVKRKGLTVIMHDAPSIPHALYRFFDAEGALLYVGITNDPGRRWSDHRRRKEWWHEVATVSVERFSSREAVLVAELAAIQTEEPKYNLVGTGRLSPIDDLDLLSASWDDERYGSIASAHAFRGGVIVMMHRHAPVDNQMMVIRRILQRLRTHSSSAGVRVEVDTRVERNELNRLWWERMAGVEFRPYGGSQLRGMVPSLKVRPTQHLLDDLQAEFDDLAEVSA